MSKLLAIDQTCEGCQHYATLKTIKDVPGSGFCFHAERPYPGSNTFYPTFNPPFTPHWCPILDEHLIASP